MAKRVSELHAKMFATGTGGRPGPRGEDDPRDRAPKFESPPSRVTEACDEEKTVPRIDEQRSGGRADPSRVRASYLQALADMQALYERELRGVGIDYVMLDTSKPLDFALLAYLDARSRRK